MYRANEITENVHKDIMNSMQIYYKMAIFMDSKNSKTSDPHRLLLNLSDKTSLKGSDKFVALSNLSIYRT